MNRLLIMAQLRLLPTAMGGRRGYIVSGYRPNWDLNNTWHGQPALDSGSVVFDDISELAPGQEGIVFIEPLAEEFWGLVDVGSRLQMQEASHVVGHATVLEVTRPMHLTRDTAAFVMQVHQFCDVVERAANHPLPARLHLAHQRLQELYQAGLALPCAVAPERAFDTVPRAPAPQHWPGFEQFEGFTDDDKLPVSTLLGPRLLSDDVIDIYRDVRTGLDLWNAQEPRQTAILHWRFHLDAHWGNLAIKALRALRYAVTAV